MLISFRNTLTDTLRKILTRSGHPGVTLTKNEPPQKALALPWKILILWVLNETKELYFLINSPSDSEMQVSLTLVLNQDA